MTRLHVLQHPSGTSLEHLSEIDEANGKDSVVTSSGNDQVKYDQ